MATSGILIVRSCPRRTTVNSTVAPTPVARRCGSFHPWIELAYRSPQRSNRPGRIPRRGRAGDLRGQPSPRGWPGQPPARPRHPVGCALLSIREGPRSRCLARPGGAARSAGERAVSPHRPEWRSQCGRRSARAVDRAVDSDEAAARVEERATRIAGVDGCICLDHVIDLAAAR